MQGFGPALYAREIILRTSPLKDGKWVNFNCFSIAMMVSAIYEIIEWLASLSNPADTEALYFVLMNEAMALAVVPVSSV